MVAIGVPDVTLMADTVNMRVQFKHDPISTIFFLLRHIVFGLVGVIVECCINESWSTIGSISCNDDPTTTC
jgi:hypothetical protein